MSFNPFDPVQNRVKSRFVVLGELAQAVSSVAVLLLDFSKNVQTSFKTLSSQDNDILTGWNEGLDIYLRRSLLTVLFDDLLHSIHQYGSVCIRVECLPRVTTGVLSQLLFSFKAVWNYVQVCSLAHDETNLFCLVGGERRYTRLLCVLDQWPLRKCI